MADYHLARVLVCDFPEEAISFITEKCESLEVETQLKKTCGVHGMDFYQVMGQNGARSSQPNTPRARRSSQQSSMPSFPLSPAASSKSSSQISGGASIVYAFNVDNKQKPLRMKRVQGSHSLVNQGIVERLRLEPEELDTPRRVSSSGKTWRATHVVRITWEDQPDAKKTHETVFFLVDQDDADLVRGNLKFEQAPFDTQKSAANPSIGSPPGRFFMPQQRRSQANDVMPGMVPKSGMTHSSSASRTDERAPRTVRTGSVSQRSSTVKTQSRHEEQRQRPSVRTSRSSSESQTSASYPSRRKPAAFPSMSGSVLDSSGPVDDQSQTSYNTAHEVDTGSPNASTSDVKMTFYYGKAEKLVSLDLTAPGEVFFLSLQRSLRRKLDLSKIEHYITFHSQDTQCSLEVSLADDEVESEWKGAVDWISKRAGEDLYAQIEQDAT